jgi:hypothetical protein
LALAKTSVIRYITIIISSAAREASAPHDIGDPDAADAVLAERRRRRLHDPRSGLFLMIDLPRHLALRLT